MDNIMWIFQMISTVLSDIFANDNKLWLISILFTVIFTTVLVWFYMRHKMSSLSEAFRIHQATIDDLNNTIDIKDKEIQRLQDKFTNFILDMKDIGDVLNSVQLKYNNAFYDLKTDNLLEVKNRREKTNQEDENKEK